MTTCRMVQETCYKTVPYTVCTMVPRTCMRSVPVTVTKMCSQDPLPPGGVHGHPDGPARPASSRCRTPSPGWSRRPAYKQVPCTRHPDGPRDLRQAGAGDHLPDGHDPVRQAGPRDHLPDGPRRPAYCQVPVTTCRMVQRDLRQAGARRRSARRSASSGSGACRRRSARCRPIQCVRKVPYTVCQPGARDDHRLLPGDREAPGDRDQEHLRAADDLQAGARRGLREGPGRRPLPAGVLPSAQSVVASPQCELPCHDPAGLRPCDKHPLFGARHRRSIEPSASRPAPRNRTPPAQTGGVRVLMRSRRGTETTTVNEHCPDTFS